MLKTAIKRGSICELEVSDLAFGGNGIAKSEGFPVFIDRCFPGDLVSVKIVKKKKTWALGRLIEVIRPSLDREAGRCRHCNYCGGCRWQNLPYHLQLEYKKRHVKESLEHIGKFKDVPVKDVIPSDSVYEYRNKI